MADLGEFGQALITHDGTPDTFRFHGEQFEVPAALSPLPLMRFAHRTKLNQVAEEQANRRMERAQAVMDAARSEHARTVAQPELTAAAEAVMEAQLDNMAAMYEFMQGCLPDESTWQRFQLVALRAGSSAEELMGVCSAIFAAVTGRPSSRPSEFSDGPSSTGGTSMDDYVSPAPTSGQPPPSAGSAAAPSGLDRLRALTALERQRAEMRGHMKPVRELLQSSG